MFVNKMKIDEMYVGKVTIDDFYVDNMSVGKMPVDEMITMLFVEKTSASKMII